MNFDPSAIPDFEGPVVHIVPDQDLVVQLLDQMGLEYGVDDDGDLVAPYPDFRTYFMFRGEGNQQVYSVRTFYDRTHPIDVKPQILDALDEWNRFSLWPKVYTHTLEEPDGTASIRVIGESQMVIGAGVAVEHFAVSTLCWVTAADAFDGWLADYLDLVEDVDSAEQPEED